MHIKAVLLSTLLIPFPLCALFKEWTEFNQQMRAQVADSWHQWQQRKNQHPTTRPHNSDTQQKETPDQPPHEEKKSITLDDIKGVVPPQIYDLRDYLKGADYFAAVGAKLPSGILLYGKPGTGKTSIARALANELNAPFFSAKGSEFIEMYVGVGAQRIRELFEKARHELDRTGAPFAIIFIDEIDALGNRNQIITCGEELRTVGELLTQMDGFNKDYTIIVIAATNRRDLIDDALLRPGRFEELIEIGLPNGDTRTEILEHYLNNPRFKHTTQGTLDVTAIAKTTEGWSGAELESVINHAAIFAARARRKTITQQDLDQAYTQVRTMRKHKN